MDNNIESDRCAIQRIKEKSEDDFEKYLTYISAGALGLSITFIDKLVPLENSMFIWFLVLGWISLALTLVINLFSHIYSAKLNDESIKDLDKNVENIHLIISKRNRKIDFVNYASLVALFLGITFTIIFTSINAIEMAKTNERTIKPSRENLEERGRTIPQPRTTTPPKKK